MPYFKQSFCQYLFRKLICQYLCRKFIYIRKGRLTWVLSFFPLEFALRSPLIRMEYNDEKVLWTQLFYLRVRLIPSLSCIAAFPSCFFSRRKCRHRSGKLKALGRGQWEGLSLPFDKWRLLAVSIATGVHVFVIPETVIVYCTFSLLGN